MSFSIATVTKKEMVPAQSGGGIQMPVAEAFSESSACVKAPWPSPQSKAFEFKPELKLPNGELLFWANSENE